MSGSSPDALYYMYINDSGYTTNASGNTKTLFSRRFYIDTTNISNNNNEATVIVQVSWQNGNLKNDFILENQFFNITRWYIEY